MERNLPHGLEAEIVDAGGSWVCVTLIAYLGDNRWRARRQGGTELVVEAEQIIALNQGCEAGRNTRDACQR
jgi:hypothetical protein